MMSNRGFSLVEIIVATTLFVGTVGFVLSAITASHRGAIDEYKKVVATHYGIEALTELYDAVRFDTWSTGTLQTGLDLNCTPVTVDGVDYIRYQDISDIGGRDYRRVVLTVKIDEAGPC